MYMIHNICYLHTNVPKHTHTSILTFMALGQLCSSFVPTSTSRFSFSYKVKHSTPTLFSHRDRNSLGMEQSCTAFGAGLHNWHVCTTRLALVSAAPLPGRSAPTGRSQILAAAQLAPSSNFQVSAHTFQGGAIVALVAFRRGPTRWQH